MTGLRSCLVGALCAVTATIANIEVGAQEPGTTFKDCSDCPEMVVLPAGKFMMGSTDVSAVNFVPPRDEQPQHEVTIARAFALGKFEVTQEQWMAVMGKNPSVDYTGPNLPVQSVSWVDAQEFIKRLNAKTGKTYRLPTEAEWEYAARAGSATIYPSGNDDRDLGQYAWYSQNSGGRMHAVGEKPANKFGLHDVLGSVWEWLQDCYESGYAKAPVDGTAVDGADCKRVVRGGSWNPYPDTMRVAYRNSYIAQYTSNVVGLRLARSLP